jgi:hypothetical protein
MKKVISNLIWLFRILSFYNLFNHVPSNWINFWKFFQVFIIVTFW